ncbi:hypothetical protein FRX31_009656 [Thalictrum thalictroides]|uniref:HTH myb-type domain-containing protein n=1 Tax=Thalictrum thalictroides TaxID=46969 RepID=A0A7J6WV23_THATH|nr:hypothetical protein FRX31_009656 [Thalictrum thalictroides]
MNLPGRTDNEIKNHWHTHLIKRSAKSYTTSKETNCKPAVGCVTLKRKESVPVPSSFHCGTLRPLILESSSLMLPVSLEKPCNLSPSTATSISEAVNPPMMTDSSSTSTETLTEFDGNFWTDPFIVDNDLYRPENTTSDWTDPSNLCANATYPNDLYDGYDMDIFFNY